MESLLKNPSVFDDDYIPRYVLYRDDEIRKIRKKLDVVFVERHPTNIVVVGHNGTGKTLVAHHILEALKEDCKELHQLFKNVVFDYHIINCAENDTIYKILADFLKSKGKGIRRDKGLVINLFKDFIRDYHHIIIVLDEFDKFWARHPNDANDFLYMVSRTLPNVSLYLISTDYTFLRLDKKLNTSTADTFRFYPIHFNEYVFDDFYGIILERMRLGIIETGWSPTITKKIVETTIELGKGVRGAMSLCLKSINKAKEDGSNVLKENHVEKASENIFDEETAQIIFSLPVPIREILFCIYNTASESSQTVTLDSISKWFQKITTEEGISVTGRTFHRYIMRLVVSGFIIKKMSRTGAGHIIEINPTFLSGVEYAYNNREFF